MFTLDNYVDALIEVALKEKNEKKRQEKVGAWFKMLKKHYRNLEGEKILEILNSKINKSEEKAQVFVSDEKEKEILGKYFEKKGISVEWKVDPDLLGGVKIIWDNKLVDSTISRQLDRLKEKLIGAK